MLIDEADLKKDLAEVIHGRDKEGQMVGGFKQYAHTLRTGKPNIEAIQNITVIYYDTPTKLSGMATFNIDGLAVGISLFDKSAGGLVEEALTAANLANVNQVSPGVFKLNFPPLTEEKRLETVKEMNKEVEENFRTRIKNIRREYIDLVDGLDKVSEDDQKRTKDMIEKVVGEAMEELKEAAEKKEAEIMSV